MTKTSLVYPHQLYLKNSAVEEAELVYLIEDPLIFSQYRFHKKKLILHRASMKSFEAKLEELGKKTKYIEARKLEGSDSIGQILSLDKVSRVTFSELNDDWINRRLVKGLSRNKIEFDEVRDPAFVTSKQSIENFGKGKSRFFFADFYELQRKEHGILVDEYSKPIGGRWSFDTDNRKKLPKGLKPPPPKYPMENKYVVEARSYVRANFRNAIGSDDNFIFPINHESARDFLADFIDHRLSTFGDYEDAITSRSDVLFHSLLSSSLNIGLLTPEEVLSAALNKEGVSLNSLEGFVRQVLGWREYVRLVYLRLGRKERTANFFKNKGKLSAAFYEGSLGIPPVDDVIKKVLNNSWCHHIERLMILGNFMLLCRIHPDEVYRWFMELFIDAYDWVMVPNVYGMSQHADGGLITTKPYISGSNYILKMSDYKKGEWSEIWDALYWTFIDDNKEYLRSNHRMRMMTSLLEKMNDKMPAYRRKTEKFLHSLQVI